VAHYGDKNLWKVVSLLAKYRKGMQDEDEGGERRTPKGPLFEVGGGDPTCGDKVSCFLFCVAHSGVG
jgi:hypothetical protein